MNANMQQIGPPVFTDADQQLARALQRSLGKPESGLPTGLVPLAPPSPTFLGGPSTDSADVSWQTPMIIALVTSFPPGVPHHNWAVTAGAATNIAHQGLLYAARYLAATAVDLITQPDRLAAIREEFTGRTAGVRWASMIPDGAQPPIYEPPGDFLSQTGQQWPPAGITWPVPPIIATEQLGSIGPDLPPLS